MRFVGILIYAPKTFDNYRLFSTSVVNVHRCHIAAFLFSILMSFVAVIWCDLVVCEIFHFSIYKFKLNASVFSLSRFLFVFYFSYFFFCEKYIKLISVMSSRVDIHTSLISLKMVIEFIIIWYTFILLKYIIIKMNDCFDFIWNFFFLYFYLFIFI